MEFKLDTARELVEETGRKYDGESKPAAWFTCTRSSDSMLSSKEHLTLIRHLAASRSLSIIVKSGNSPVSVIPAAQVLRKPLPLSPRSPLSSSNLASTSLQTIQPRSSQLLGQVKAFKSDAHSKAGILVQQQQHAHSASSPNIAASIASSSASLTTSKKSDTIKEEEDAVEVTSDDDWAMESDDDMPPRSGTPPLIDASSTL